MKREPTSQMHSSKHWYSGCSQKWLSMVAKQREKWRLWKVKYREPTVEGKETGTQINGVDQKEERNIQPEKNEAIRIQKNEERLRNLQAILKRSNIRIIGVPEGEEEEQKIENLFEQIMKENFPNLAKDIDFQEVQ